MASKLAKRSHTTTHRRPSPLIAKLKDRLRSANRRAANASGGGSRMMRDAIAVGGAAGLGKLEAMGHVPARLAGLPTGLVAGGIGAFLLPRFVGGKLGTIAHDLSLGALCVAGYQVGGGQPVMGEDGLEGGGWGP